MKQQPKIIIALAIIVALVVIGFMYFSFDKNTNTFTNPTTTPTSTPALTQNYNGKTFIVHKGERFVLTLGDMMWNLSFTPDTIVNRVKNIATLKGSQGVYTADTVGTTVLKAEGRPICAEGQMCAQYIVQFTSTIVVQ
jgi:hypothetical protein